MENYSFTDEQLLNLVNGAISEKTEFTPNDFTGGSIQTTSTNNNRITNYKVSLFFGYKSKKPITRTFDIDKELFFIWTKAIFTKTQTLENQNIGMNYSELNRLMNPSISREVVSKEVVSKVESPIQVEVPVEVPKKEYKTQSDFSLGKDTYWSKTTAEYKQAVREFIDNFIIELENKVIRNGGDRFIPAIDADDFILALESKDRKYTNFVATYRTWLRNANSKAGKQ